MSADFLQGFFCPNKPKSLGLARVFVEAHMEREAGGANRQLVIALCQVYRILRNIFADRMHAWPGSAYVQ